MHSKIQLLSKCKKLKQLETTVNINYEKKEEKVLLALQAIEIKSNHNNSNQQQPNQTRPGDAKDNDDKKEPTSSPGPKLMTHCVILR